jgi:ABC-type amino acid transport system permease subunit
MYNLNLEFLLPYLHQFFEASKITLQLGVIIFIISSILSVLIGFLRTYELPKIIKFILSS